MNTKSTLLIALFWIHWTTTTHAATFTWQTSGTTTTWSTGAGDTNWYIDAGTTLSTWADANDAVFSGLGATIALSGILTPTSTTIGAGNGAWIFNGSGNLAGGTLAKTGTGDLTFSNTTANNFSSLSLSGTGMIRVGDVNNLLGTGMITLGSAVTFSRSATAITSNLISIGNNVSNGGFTLTATAGSGRLGLTGIISGTGGLSANSSSFSRIVLSGLNTYTGVTSIFGGSSTTSSSTTTFTQVAAIGNGGTAGNLGAASSAASNLVFGVNGSTAGQLTYTGVGESTDRLFTMAAHTVIVNNGTGALNFTNTGSLVHTTGTHNLVLGGSYAASANLFAPVITNGSGGTVSLYKVDAGSWTLTGANTYTGATTVSGGMLQFAKETSLYNDTTASWTAANLTVSSGATAAFNVGGTGEFTAADISTIQALTNVASGVTATLGFKSGSFIGLDTSNAAGGTFIYGSALANHVAGSTTDTLGLIKFGTGTLQLTGTNTYTGSTTVIAGVLQFGKETSLYNNSTASWTAANLIVNTGTTAAFNVGGAGEFTAADINTLQALTNVASGVSATQGFRNGTFIGLDTTDAPGTFVYGSVLANHVAGGTTDTLGLTKLGTGTLQLTAANTFTGDTNANAGTLNLANISALQNSSLNLNGGTVVFDSSVAGNAFTLGGLKGTGNLTLANNAGAPAAVALTVGANNASTSYSGSLSGAGSLTKSGSGTLTLSGASSYSGITTVSGGALVLTGSNSSAGTTTLSSGTLRVGAGALASGLVTLNGGTITGLADGVARTIANNLTIPNAGTLVSFGDATATGALIFTGTMITGSATSNRTLNTVVNTTFSGVLSGTNNALIKSGAAKLTLSNTASTTTLSLSGGSVGLIVTAGIVEVTRLANATVNSSIGKTSGLTATTASITLDGGELNYIDGGAAASSTDRLLQIGRTTAGASGAIRNNATNASETVIFSNTNSIAYGTVDQTRSLILGGSNTGANTLASVINDNGAGVVSVSKQDAGTWVLSGNNGYSGTTTITGGTLSIASTGTTGSGAVTVQSGSTILGTGSVHGSSFTAQSGSSVYAGDGTAQGNYGTLNFTPVSGSGSFNFQSGSSVILGINPGGTGDLLSFNGLSAGTLLFNGNLQVTASGYTPTSAQTFKLLDWSNLTTLTFANQYSSSSYSGYLLGNGDDSHGFDLPNISGSGYGWDISQFTTNGTISTVILVPEAARMMLVFSGLVGIRLRRRRY